MTGERSDAVLRTATGEQKVAGRRVRGCTALWWLIGEHSPPVNDLRLLLAIGVVAAAAVLADRGHCRLEAVEIPHSGVGLLGFGAELDELGVEIGLVFPDGRQGCGVATGLRA